MRSLHETWVETDCGFYGLMGFFFAALIMAAVLS